MIRVVLFLGLAGLAAFAAAWFADRPGDVSIVWLGYRIETSVMVLAGAMAILAVLVIFSWSVGRAVMNAPDTLSLFLRHRRSMRGYLAISRGLIAIGSGDTLAVRKFVREAIRLAPDDPLTLLLAAQSAQLSGDRALAERTFRIMAEREDTKLLGLRGLYIEAQRRDDMQTARSFAEEAAKADASLAWAGQAMLEFRCTDGDWTGALAALERNMKSGLLAKPAYRRQRAVLQTARALALEETARDAAKSLALEAVKLAPDLVPAAAQAGRLIAGEGDARKAGRMIETAWRAHPHPDLAEAYAYLKPGDSARDRLTRVQALARKSGDHIEGALAVARAAIDAREFSIARAVLAPLSVKPTQRVAALMAELEEMEHGDIGRAREWMARALTAARDPVWTADGFVSDKWMPVSPVTGRVDAFEWKVPLAEIAVEGPLIEEEKTLIAPAVPAMEGEQPSLPAHRRKAVAQAAGAVRAGEPVIPLVHAPDDPGLEPEPPAPADGWRKLRLLFRLS